MQASAPAWPKAALLAGQPDVGALMSLCEENYARLLRLAPQVREIRGERVSHRPRIPALHLEVVECSPYTTLLRLTHDFSRPHECAISRREPNALLRLYHDARQVEVIELHQSLWPQSRTYRPPALAHKWQSNVFLSKWLDYCLAQGHCFTPGARHPDQQRASLPV